VKDRLLRNLWLFLGILTATVLVSWPLASQLGEVLTSGRADGDLGYTLNAHWWAGEVLTGGSGFPINEKVYFPAGQNMAGSVWNFVALFGSAWPHLFAGPLTAYQIGLIWLMCLNGLAAALLGHRLGGRWGAFGATCTVLAFPYPWMEAFEGRLEQGFLAPMLLLFWAALDLKEGRSERGRKLGALMALVAASYWFYAPVAAIGLLFFFGKALGKPALRAKLREAALFCGLFLIPFLLLIWPALKGGAYQNAIQDPQHILYTRVGNAVNPWEVLSGGFGPANLGRCLPVLVVVGLLVAWRSHRQSRVWIGLAGVGLLFAMGPALSNGQAPTFVGDRLIPLPFAILDWVPGMSRFWWPYRFLALVGVGAVAGMALLFSRLPSARRPQAAFLLAGLLLFEGRTLLIKATKAGDSSIPSSVWDPEPQGAFYTFSLPEWMQKPPATGAILEFPMAEVANFSPIYGPFHRLPTAHGDGVREAHIRPPDFHTQSRENRLFSSWAQNLLPDVDKASVQSMFDLGFRHVLVHKSPDQDSAISERSAGILRRLEAALGPPTHSEERLTVFDLDPEGMN